MRGMMGAVSIRFGGMMGTVTIRVGGMMIPVFSYLIGPIFSFVQLLRRWVFPFFGNGFPLTILKVMDAILIQSLPLRPRDVGSNAIFGVPARDIGMLFPELVQFGVKGFGRHSVLGRIGT